MKLYTQLNFGGDCEEAFRYYEQHLGGTITMMMHGDESPVPAKLGGRAVIHARMSVAGVELIGNDVPAEIFQPVRSSYLYLQADSAEQAETFWAALSDGGQVGWPLKEEFYATRFGQVRDTFGVLWSVIHPKPMQ
jgi:PhnB protein